jgi:3,4-dihydroxy 2-butanone 4-phosphate synthase / GTP cyclohydrolase II
MHDGAISRVAETELPTAFGAFRIVGYQAVDGDEYVAVVKGNVKGSTGALVRLHSECLTGDTFRSLRCDCGEQLHHALEMIDQEGRGVVVYLPQEGRGIGLLNKLRAYRLQDDGLDTVDANVALHLPVDGREYGLAALILIDLGLSNVRLLTNNPSKTHGLRANGISVNEQVPIQVTANAHNRHYLHTKVTRLGHARPTSAVSGHVFG